jgi:hypothetical protein
MGGTKATLDISDMHYGDSAQLLGTLRECMGRAIGVVRSWQPDEIEVVLNGDAVAGRGVYRDQGMQNAIQFGAEQVWFAAYDIYNWQKTLRAGRWVVVKGNHDHAHKENLASQLVAVLRLLGVNAVYFPRAYVGNFAQDDGDGAIWFDAQHGFGASSYYANSYEAIRECWRLYIERSMVDNLKISRFLRAHTHWLNTGQVVGFGVSVDTTGGWHRQERDKLPSDTRNTGVLAYRHDGQQLTVTPVEANRKLLVEETQDCGLHYKTMSEAARALQVMSNWAHQQGLG